MTRFKKFCKRAFCVVLCLSFIVCSNSILGKGTTAEAARGKTLSLTKAKQLALANSESYNKIKNSIALKEVGYSNAVKSLQLKKKNLTTFRWTPLMSFKFPQKLTLDQESEFKLKPMQIQNEITELKHDLNDEIFAVYEKVSSQFTKVYTLQESIKFSEEQLVKKEEALTKNEGRLAKGEASQKDVDSLRKTIETITKKITENKRNFEAEKEKLRDIIGLDITVGYAFQNPYLGNSIPRSVLNDFIRYTLDNDQSYYEAKYNSAFALTTLNFNSGLMRESFGDDVFYISGYINAIKAGQKVDSSAFKLQYAKMLEDVDEPWKGKKRIFLFVKVPRVWFKGATDGSRYVENDPYMVYTNALDYQSALSDQKTLEADLTQQVKDGFENLVSAYNSYMTLVDSVADQKKEVDSLLVLNTLGKCDMEEYMDACTQLEDLQNNMQTSLDTYTTLLFQYDRLTCGAVSKYFRNTGIDFDLADSGMSYIVKQDESIEGCQYIIESVFEDSMFRFNVYVPDDFQTNITHYEVWVNGVQVGNERTEIDKTLVHLTLDIDSVDSAYVRFFENDKYIAQAPFDAGTYNGPLDIPGQYTVEPASDTVDVGSYELSDTEFGMISLQFSFKPEEKVCYYNLTDRNGKPFIDENLMEATKPFRYLQILEQSLNDVIVVCYDENKNKLYDANLNTGLNTVYRKRGDT